MCYSFCYIVITRLLLRIKINQFTTTTCNRKTISNMVAESEQRQQAGHPLLRPREAHMVGTPTQWTSSEISRSRRARNVFSSSFERANDGEQNGLGNSLHLQKLFRLRAVTVLWEEGVEAEVVDGRELFQVDPTSLPLKAILLGLCQRFSKRILTPKCHLHHPPWQRCPPPERLLGVNWRNITHI